MNNKTKTAVIALICFAIFAILTAFVLLGNKTYEVSFDTKGGSYVALQTVKKGSKVTKPRDPVKNGYSFVRWEYQNKEYNFDSAVSSNMTLDAVWSQDEVITNYKITFKLDGKTKIIEISDMKQLDLQTLGFEEKNGYEIIWYLNGKKFDFDSQLTSDVSLEGKYEKIVSYTVTFNSAGGSKVASQTVAIGGKAKEPTNVKRYGYILDGWYLNNKKYDFDAVVEANIKLVAKWKEDTSVKRYEVKFDSDGGTKVASQTILENNTVKQPNAITKAGYVFEGWYLNDTKYNFNTKVTKNMTLVAKWRKLASYTVTFDSNGGSNVASQTVNEGGKATKPTNPTRNGYTFVEWQLDGKAYDFTKVVTGNITLKAVWKSNEVTKYTVTFNSNGGSSVASQTVNEGGKATKPTNPTKNGYEFVEWQVDGKAYNFNGTVTKNITLTAVWKENTKTYTFKVTLVDDQSPDRIITVYEDGKKIDFTSIKVNGTVICNGTNPTVNKYQIINQESITVVLKNGTSVTAKKG